MPESFELPRPQGGAKSPDEAIIGPAFTLMDAGLLGAPPAESARPSSPFEQSALEPVPEPEPLRLPLEEPVRRRLRDEWSMLDQETPYPSGGGAAAVMSLLVQEVDGTPSINVATLKVRNGCLSDEGNGTARLNAIGTEAEAVLTAGSVVFAGSNGLLQQDNANFSWDDANDRLTIGTGSLTVNGKAGQTTVFNESGVDQDFRVEGDADSNLLFCDASSDAVGIGTSSIGSTTKLRIVFQPTSTAFGAYTPISAEATAENTSHAASNTLMGAYILAGTNTSAVNYGNLTGISVQAWNQRPATSTLTVLYGASVSALNMGTGTISSLYGLWVNAGNNTSGSIGTAFGIYVQPGAVAGSISTFYGIYVAEPPANASTRYALFTGGGQIVFNENGGDHDLRVEGDTASYLLFLDASTDAVQIGTTVAGVIADFRSSAIVFNEDGSNRDFRVEGDTDANLLFTDASADLVGIGTNAPGVKLDINGGLALRATSPSQITSNQNDYAIGAATFFRLSTDASRTITGFTGGVDGKLLVIRNVGSNDIVLANQSASSSASNRIITGTGGNLTIGADQMVVLFYDSTTSRWVVL